VFVEFNHAYGALMSLITSGVSGMYDAFGMYESRVEFNHVSGEFNQCAEFNHAR
jgi:hypothetical protein